MLIFSAWDQSEKFVKIYLTGLDGAKDLQADAYEFKVNPRSIYLKINGLKGKNLIFTVKETPYQINTEKSYYKAKSGKSRSRCLESF